MTQVGRERPQVHIVRAWAPLNPHAAAVKAAGLALVGAACALVVRDRTEAGVVQKAVDRHAGGVSGRVVVCVGDPTPAVLARLQAMLTDPEEAALMLELEAEAAVQARAAAEQEAELQRELEAESRARSEARENVRAQAGGDAARARVLAGAMEQDVLANLGRQGASAPMERFSSRRERKLSAQKQLGRVKK